MRVDVRNRFVYMVRYGNWSDIRLKTDVQRLGDGVLERVLKIRPVSFRWKDRSDEKGNSLNLGLIAQEVEEYFPQLVMESSDGYKALDQGGLIAILLKSIQELRAEKERQVEELREQLSSQKREFDAQRALLEQKDEEIMELRKLVLQMSEELSSLKAKVEKLSRRANK